MNTPYTTEETYHVSNIIKHYTHAKEKHPYFCDMVMPDVLSSTYFARHLEDVRRTLALLIKHEIVYPEMILDCEIAELLEALERRDYKQAVEECYDIAAVALRWADVIEGRQNLGKPEAKGETK